MDTLLAQLVEEVEGALGAAVGATDGLLVEQHAKEDLSAAVAEHANLLRSGNAAYSRTLGYGDVREIMLVSDQRLGFIRPVGNGLFLLLLLEPGGNLGKARLRSADAARRLEELVGA
ncbi:putative regulator of Ras-like GTPase activity (Roadblock/LC7/MglB family) [Deinobacterium chartae]|uniref:Putative regulator of Ras-like GTPase activity (Roadblock/LC7/MglB family) n=1 Tax=Deinobacterium chartae TaxID=521158 RepID=A0A841I4H0_9DEIO|nr:roadblock/LC7 domain-containing protein [Deinobacterium chartae]MBB6099310.1 putative regulator of Ras-like GTPase activity (Roadblock/LC7/MglB family) [Deinobacterium chartae]